MTPEFHLTDEQIDDYLMGDLSAEATAHLEGCDPCLVRVAAAEQPLASFRDVSLAWSERRSATLPLQEFSPAPSRWTGRLLWGATAAAAIAIGVAIPSLHRPSASGGNVAVAAAAPAPAVAVTQVAQISREEQIARDNQMLRAIDRELDASAESPAAFGLTADIRSRNHNRASMQD